MIDGEWDPDDVLVVIGHPWGDVEMPLAKWMARGPGPRHGIRPGSARSRTTGGRLPLTVIPLAYRNNRESRALIAAGKIESPWRGAPWDVDNWGERPCEVGGPRAFDRSVANPERVDGLASRVLGLVLAGPVDAEDARLVLAQVPEFCDAAHLIVRRLAAEARWEEFDAIVQLAGAAALVDVGPVLCDVLESDARPPRPGHIVDVLGQLRYDDAVELLERLLGRFVYAEVDLSNARRCLRALSVMGTDRSRAKLHIISWYDWPAPIPQWAAEELLVDTGVVLGEVGDDGRWTPGWRIPGWDPDGGGSS